MPIILKFAYLYSTCPNSVKLGKMAVRSLILNHGHRKASFETMLQVTGLPLDTWIVEGVEIVCCKFGSSSMRHRSSLGCWLKIEPIIDFLGRLLCDAMKPYE